MFTYKEFKQKYNKIEEGKIKKLYEKYKYKNYEEWLAAQDVKTINKVGLETMWKIWEAIDCCDK